MHGVIFLEFSKFARQLLGADAWRGLRHEVDAPDVYRAGEVYDDAQLEGLLRGASERTGLTRELLLEQFGEYIVAPLLDIYGGLIPEEWQLFDLLENTESVIHHVVRLRVPDADPPRLRIERVSTVEVKIYYDSPRKMCWLGKGIIAGLSQRYGQRVVVADVRCMGEGDPICEISVTGVESAGNGRRDRA